MGCQKIMIIAGLQAEGCGSYSNSPWVKSEISCLRRLLSRPGLQSLKLDTPTISLLNFFKSGSHFYLDHCRQHFKNNYDSNASFCF